MSAHHEPRRYPVGALVSAWRVYAQRDGITDPDTLIDAEPAGASRGYWPMFVTADGVPVILTGAAPAPTARAARNRLRDLLWQAHLCGAISLHTHRTPALQEAV